MDFRRELAAWSCAAVVAATLTTITPPVAEAQQWNSPAARELVQRATDRRAAQLADTALRSYQADARGYLTFLAQLGEGFPEPPKIVKADEIALDVYWRAPDLSRQLVKGRRDTLLLPTNINYHPDHLGIVQNNFPSVIRLGEGDEVRDVPHPLSSAGLPLYDFAIQDSLRIRLGPRTLDVYEVRVRPTDDREPRAVGSVYIDRESGDVARMALSFTRAALKDKALEDVSITLENGLIDGRFWLPRQQEIEIRRAGSWLDYPARGIIRGRWVIQNYRVNVPIVPAMFASGGREIVLAPGARMLPGGDVVTPGFSFGGGILDSLPPEVRAATGEDVARVQAEARALVRGQALARSRTTALSARRVSDFVRVNRVEGLALGAGVLQRLGRGFMAGGNASYGTADHQIKGRATLAHRRGSGAGVELSGYSVLREASDVPESSLLRNSFAAQEFGSDYTEPFRARGASLRVTTGTLAAWRLSAALSLERQDSARVNARPANGRYEPTIPAASLRATRLSIGLDMPTRIVAGGVEARITSMASAVRNSPRGATSGGAMPAAATSSTTPTSLGRFSADISLERPFEKQRLVLRTVAAAAVGGYVPPQDLVYLGGPVTGPGYDFHQFAGRAGVSQRVEWRTPVPFLPISLGEYGKVPSSATLAPFASALWISRPAGFRSGRAGWYPSVGIGALTIFDLLRVDVARGLRDGRWTLSVDVSRDFWGVL